jgi:endonuclease/exonuclease/phosphatase family metal-dependent hydrolase
MKKLLLCFLVVAPLVTASPEKELKILSLNTALLAIFSGQVGYGMKQNYRRAERIAEEILSMDETERPDVIVGQEGFDPRATKKLTGDLKTEYPYHWRDERLGALLVGANSGLFFLSRYPFSDRKQQDFQDFAGDGVAAKKGIRGAKIELDGQPLWIFTAHLQAGISSSKLWKALGLLRKPYSKKTDRETANQIRLLQFRQAREFIETETSPEEPIIFTGDFNTPAQDEAEFTDPQTGAVIQRNKTMAVVFGEGKDTYSGPEDEGSEWNSTPSKRIDYSLNLQEQAGITATSRILPQFTKEDPRMTDHKGVMTTVILDK